MVLPTPTGPGLAVRPAPAGLAASPLPPVTRSAGWRAARRRSAARPLAARQVAVAAPQPQPPAPGASDPRIASAPKWAFAAGMLAVAAAAAKLALSFKQPASAPPAPPSEPALGSTAEESAAMQAARAAVQQAGEALAGSGAKGAAAAAAAAAGPVLLAGETAGAVDETATMSLEELRATATELYMLIQQMELSLQDLQYDLASLLPEASLAQLDRLTEEAEGVEGELARLKGKEGAEDAALKAEQRYADVQWRQFELLTERAADGERRTYRSLLFNLRTQRQLLRQVEAQEALRVRMEATKARIDALLDAEAQRQGGGGSAGDAAAAPAVAQQQQQQQQAAAPAAQQLRLASAGVSIPHPAKAATGGEDALFVSTHGLGAVGVADGVGGWAAEGIDPALYPRRLMAACEEALAAADSSDPAGTIGGAAAAGDLPPAAALLAAAHARTDEPGSCTVILGVLLPGGRLSVANLGDCELKVLRGGGVAYSSEVLEHQWNMPLQLSSPRFYDCGSTPADAETAEVALAPGDVVVVGSDGLWDNLWEDQLLEAAAEEARGAAQARALGLQAGGAELAAGLAQRLADIAFEQSGDPTFVSPFSVEREARVADAAAAAGLVLPTAGGKRDDISCVVAVVEAA